MSYAGETIVFTGKLVLGTRPEAEAKAQAAGAKTTSAVSGKTTILVAGPGAGSKEAAAKAKGIKVITEAQFESGLKGKGAKAKKAAPKAAGKKTAEKPAKKAAAKPAKKPAAKKAAAKKAPAKKSKAVVEEEDEDEDDEDDDEEEVIKPPTKKTKKEPAAASDGARRVDREVPGGDKYSVVGKWNITLNQTNVGENNNKFYKIQVLTDGKKYFAWNRWGRVGEPGQNKLEPCASEDAAIKSFQKKFSDKTKNKWAAYEAGSFSKVEGKYGIVELDEDEGSGDSAAPLGKLSRAQIEKGQGVLIKLGDAIEKNQKSKLNDLSSEFFTLVPTDIGRKKTTAITSEEKVKELEELLKFYLRMGFDEEGDDDKSLAPIAGISDEPLPKTLSEAAKLLCAMGEIDKCVKNGKKLAHLKKGAPTRPMTEEEYGSVLLYTSNAIYQDLNRVLRSEDRKAAKKYFKYLRLLFHSTDALPKKEKTLWRGISCDLSKQYKKGSDITWWGVSSCTEDKKVAENFMQSCGGDVSFLTIETKTSVPISDITFYSNEKESLLLPGTKLKILDVQKKGKVAHIHLQEVDRVVN